MIAQYAEIMKLTPLSPVRFHILLALADKPATAWLIASRVAYDTLGEIDLSPATLHDNLQRLLSMGWVIQQRDRQYQICSSGYEQLQDDLYRWRIVTSRATDRLRSRGSNVYG